MITATAIIQGPAIPISSVISGSSKMIPIKSTSHEVSLFIFSSFI